MPETNILGFDTRGWLASAQQVATYKPDLNKGPIGTIVLVGQSGDTKKVISAFGTDLNAWQAEQAQQRRGQVYELSSTAGPVWFVALPPEPAKKLHGGQLDISPYGLARDMVGSVFRADHVSKCKQLVLVCEGASREEKLGALVGLETGSYTFKDPNRKRFANIIVAGFADKLVSQARDIGVAVNLARHLVNSPANELNPSSYPDCVKSLFPKSGSTKVEVWNYDRLKKEKMNLICAVGQAAEHMPCMIHMRYRPKGKKSKRPIAYVGKGITFDSGGLDIKPPAGMRLMKKDMGGSASVVGLAYWLDRSGFDHPADLYLAVAENAISAEAFRPGDVIKARNGLSVEIDNTDAEGRLVMADVLTVATEKKGADAPRQVINLATLTGAMRVALGMKIGGMFTNDDEFADRIRDASVVVGEPVWRMPLFRPYRELLNSTTSDMLNSGGQFGGAITAALFLERFVNDVPWAHFDIFTWADRPEGYCVEPGGTGQSVQTLISLVQGKL